MQSPVIYVRILWSKYFPKFFNFYLISSLTEQNNFIPY